MERFAQPEFAVTVSSRRWSCILDPLLAVTSPLGPTLVQALSQVVDLWMTASFWRILDSSEFYAKKPAALTFCTAQAAKQETALALHIWEQIRTRTDAASCRFHWVGDSYTQSSLSETAPPDLVRRFELLHEALQMRTHESGRQDRGVHPEAHHAALETVALAACLSPIFILTRGAHNDGVPPLAAMLEQCHIHAQQVCAEDALAVIERDSWRRALVSAGLAKLRWSGLQLAILHVLAPSAQLLSTPFDHMLAGADMIGAAEDIDVADDENDRCTPAVQAACWSDATAYWYAL
jgi:hypothetical protein